VNVVDSSAWLEYFAGGPNADVFASAIQDVERLVVPTLSLCEVFRCILRQRGEEAALEAAAAMHDGTVVELASSTALLAARLGHEHGLPMADAVILATAVERDATLWTQDADFEGLDRVEFHAKRN
jgi:predicted nucleic acid-binding protein